MLRGQTQQLSSIFIFFNFSAPPVSKWFKLFKCSPFFSLMAHLMLLLSLMASILSSGALTPLPSGCRWSFRVCCQLIPTFPTLLWFPHDQDSHHPCFVHESLPDVEASISFPANYLLNRSWYTSISHKHIKSHTLKTKSPFPPIPPKPIALSLISVKTITYSQAPGYENESHLQHLTYSQS